MKKTFLSLWILLLCITAKAETPLRLMVAADGSADHRSIQAAIDAAPNGIRTIIFIKNGIYKEYVTIGSKAYPEEKQISLIGESRDGVIVTSDRNREENGLTFEDITTVKVYLKDFYAENLTIQNTAGEGRCEALYTHADKYTFKNVRIAGTQDTYKSNDNSRGYFTGCRIEGSVDFIYGGGTIFFDDCQLICVRESGYITAPSEAGVIVKKSLTEAGIILRFGLIFRGCEILATDAARDNSFYLGRPWKERSAAAFIGCRLGNHIHPQGWKEWNGNEATTTMGEYGNTDLNGNPIDNSNRTNWSMQFFENDKARYITPEYIYKTQNATSLFDPQILCKLPANATNVQMTDGNLSWEGADGVGGYLIYRDSQLQKAVDASTTNIPVELPGNYSVRSFSTNGTLGEAVGMTTSLTENAQERTLIRITDDEVLLEIPGDITFYLPGGQLIRKNSDTRSASLKTLPRGIIIIQAICPGKSPVMKKITLK